MSATELFYQKTETRHHSASISLLVLSHLLQNHVHLVAVWNSHLDLRFCEGFSLLQFDATGSHDVSFLAPGTDSLSIANELRYSISVPSLPLGGSRP